MNKSRTRVVRRCVLFVNVCVRRGYWCLRIVVYLLDIPILPNEILSCLRAHAIHRGSVVTPCQNTHMTEHVCGPITKIRIFTLEDVFELQKKNRLE